jgi:DNA-binding NarL/FixJ family response regulator
MPVISGGECYSAMKKICPTVETIITSGHAMDNEIGEVLKEGALAFVQKPFEIDDLAAAVEKALGGSR